MKQVFDSDFAKQIRKMDMTKRFLVALSLFIFLTACGQTISPSTIIDAKAGGFYWKSPVLLN
jgi:hypothetical protein